VPPDIARSLQEDREHVLDEHRRAVEIGRHGHPRALPRIGRHRRTRVHVDERADVAAELVLLAVHAGLQLRELLVDVLVGAVGEQLAARAEPPADGGERLRVAVVQRACDLLALRAGLELTDARLLIDALLSQIPDQITGDRDVRGPHDDEEVLVAGRGHDDDQRVEQYADAGHDDRRSPAGAHAGGEHREGEERVERARDALGDERDRGGEQHVAPGRDLGEQRRRQPLLRVQVVQADAVDQVRDQHARPVAVEGEGAARERQPAGEARLQGIDVQRDDRDQREQHAAARDAALHVERRPRHGSDRFCDATVSSIRARHARTYPGIGGTRQIRPPERSASPAVYETVASAWATSRWNEAAKPSI
jgi:hypothetical protein